MAHTQSVITRCIAVLGLFLLTHSAAAQQWHTTIEIAYPAQITLPQQISELLLVNNTVAHPDVPLGAFYTLMAASETLEGSDYLPSVLETSQNESGSIYRKQLLSAQKVDSLLTLYGSDALLVLNQQIVHPTTESFATQSDTYYAYVEAIAATHWTLYYRKDANAPLPERIAGRNLQYADTLYWESEAENIQEAVAALPSMEEARNEMCVYIGEHLASRFLPQIETEDRYLYDLGKDDAGMQYFARKQWQQAIDAWAQPQSDNKAAAYAAANSAVAYELLGDIDSACAAAEKSITYFSALRSSDARQQAVNMRYYLEQLQSFPHAN